MAHSITWDAPFDATPADNDEASVGASDIRGFKDAIRERVALDHYFDIAGTDAEHGEHLKITLHAPISKPTAVADKGFIYSKDVDNKAELHYLDEDDNEIQLTSKGVINVVSRIVGEIILWSDSIATIPSGWVICDGNNGTPNLTDRFVIHADADSSGTRDVGDTGGSHTMIDHTHTDNLAVANETHKHNVITKGFGGGSGGSGIFTGSVSTAIASSVDNDTHNHPLTGGVGSGSAAGSTASIPKFYALAYIMYTG